MKSQTFSRVNHECGNQLLCPSIKKFQSRPTWSSTSTLNTSARSSAGTLRDYGRYLISHHAISLFFFTLADAPVWVHEVQEGGRVERGWVWMILTSSPPAVSSSSSAPTLTGPLLFQRCVGSPRFPCVRNHPPTCCKQTGARDCETVYWESVGCRTGPDERQRDCRENNKRQAPTHTHTHTHTHTRTCRDAMQANTHAVTLQSRLEGPMGVGWRDG